MPRVGHTWEFEDQKFWIHLPPDVMIELWVKNIEFSRYCPATWESPAEGGDLESYEIGDIIAYDGNTPIPLTKDQESQIAEWAHGREDLEETILSGDYFD